MIPFVVPLAWRGLLASGKIIRYGAILKDAKTGRIVAHLKETGSFSQIFNNIPFSVDPLNSITNILDTSGLSEIKESLELLELISSVGAISSLANLGISVGGFTLVTQKLKSIEKNLNIVVNKVEKVIKIAEKIDSNLEFLNFADVKTASEQLHNALFASDEKRRRELLIEANSTFRKYKNYYLAIAKDKKLWVDGSLPLDVANILYSRYITCVLGELYSEFLLGDMQSYMYNWQLNYSNVKEISSFNKIDVLRIQSDYNLNNELGNDYSNLKEKIIYTDSILKETSNRIDTMKNEADYIIKHNIKPYDYIKELSELEDNVVIIKH
ncbi:hypothetical protein ACH5BF_07845 [Arcobacter sp. YIC-464]|uniref:hypothetical protein n=1 Tax=Arcobacter sp. YIC-464 TaxID=3376631 RepID=UPI003C21BEBF